jgi:hypothetical protein
MAQINWTIRQLERHIVNGIVTRVYWKCEVIDGIFTAAAQDVVTICDDLSTIDTNAAEFTQFENLSESQIVDWVKGKLGSEEITNIVNGLTYNIDIQKDYATNFVYGLPWEEAPIEEEIPESEE